MNQITFFKKIPTDYFFSSLWRFLLSFVFCLYSLTVILSSQKTRELLIFTDSHVTLAPSNTQGSDSAGLSISWDNVVEIRLEDYSTYHWRPRWAGSMTKNDKLYFFTTNDNKKIWVISRYLHELRSPKSEIEFFTIITKFYKGQIVKQIGSNQFKILKQTSDKKFEWVTPTMREFLSIK